LYTRNPDNKEKEAKQDENELPVCSPPVESEKLFCSDGRKGDLP
jgi:hypothetical protein